MRSSSRWEEGSNTTLTTMQKQWVAFQKHWKTRSQRGFSLVSKCLNWTVKIDQLCGGEEHWGELESWTTLRTRCVQQARVQLRKEEDALLKLVEEMAKNLSVMHMAWHEAFEEERTKMARKNKPSADNLYPWELLQHIQERVDHVMEMYTQEWMMKQWIAHECIRRVPSRETSTIYLSSWQMEPAIDMGVVTDMKTLFDYWAASKGFNES